MGSVTMVLSSIYGGLRGPDIFHSGPHIHIKYSHCVVGLRQSNRCSQWDSTFITRPVTWRLHQPGKLNVKCVTKGSRPRLIWERMHTNSITKMMWVMRQSASNCLQSKVLTEQTLNATCATLITWYPASWRGTTTWGTVWRIQWRMKSWSWNLGKQRKGE